MATIRKSPNNVTQTSGSSYVTFNGLNNIKNTSAGTYALSSTYIKPKSFPAGNRPAPVSATNFKFNLPNNAVVKKITVHYRHSRRALCTSGGNAAPCSSSNLDNRCNIPAPTISVLNTNLSKKGQAPYAKIGNQSGAVSQYITSGSLVNTATFKVNNLPASVVNSSNFGVKINYPANANNKEGYVLLNYIYVDLEYYTPSFTVTSQSANPDKVYNKDSYHLKVNLSDSNLTGKTSNINISVPSGFTYTGIAGVGNGKVETVSGGLLWTPNMSAYSASVELVFEVNVSFAQGTSSVNKTFTIGLVANNTTITHTATIYKELPPSHEIDDNTPQDFNDNTKTPDLSIKEVTIDEVFNYTLQIDDTTWDSMIQTIFNYGTEQGWFTGTLEDNLTDIKSHSLIRWSDATDLTGTYLSENQKLQYHNYRPELGIDTWISTKFGFQFTYFESYDIRESTFEFKGVSSGYDEINLIYFYDNSPHTSPAFLLNVWKFDIRPLESSLSEPFLTRLEPTTEEQNRLGNGYNYTVQTYLKLNTSETYVRDWYKNFRIGVFNNPVLSNITSYLQYNNTDTTFDGYLLIPTIYDLTGATLTISTDHSIILNETTVTTTTTLSSLTEYNIPMTFAKDETDNCILTLILKDGDNTTLWTKDYHINFNAETTTDLEEVSTDTTDYDNLTANEIFSNAEYWATETAGLNTFNSVECEFTYNKNYPLYLLITGDYPESTNYDTNTINFTEPCIIETTQYTTAQPNGNYPIQIDDLVLEDNSSSTITLNPYTVAETIVFYNLPLEDDYGTNTERAIRGIALTGEIQQADRLVLSAKLRSPTGESRERSIVINDYNTTIDADNTFTIGGNGDLWGFNTLDMTNLEDWECEFTISNSLEDNDSTINFGNVKLILYVETVTNQNLKCYINGEDIAYYGVFLTDLNIPEGLETDTAYLSVDGTDINDSYRQNIREKQITLNFEIGDGCSLESATLSLREFAKLLVNDRDEYNRPIPKRIEFAHYPDVYWEYIMEDAFDSEIDINTYTVKANLIIPAGTSYDKENTTTSNTGYINGLANINPTIIVKPTGEVVTIRETVTGQEFHIGYTGEWTDKIIELDCENRICWLKANEDDTAPINLNKYVDFNSDWFTLKGEYAFEGVNCVIRTIDYAERW